jgi:hypothetical protein
MGLDSFVMGKVELKWLTIGWNGAPFYSDGKTKGSSFLQLAYRQLSEFDRSVKVDVIPSHLHKHHGFELRLPPCSTSRTANTTLSSLS